MNFTQAEIVALVVGASFAAGLNVYATVATLGVLGRMEVLNLPQQLQLVENPVVIAAAVGMFLIEFIADKIPAIDLIWNALHTFVRVPAAALLSYAATAELSPMAQVLAAVLGGGVALAAHGGKMAARTAVTPSPEPVSNIGLSLVEDVAAIGLTWFAVEHPYIAAGIVFVLVVLMALLIRWVIRAMRGLFRGARRRFDELHAA